MDPKFSLEIDEVKPRNKSIMSIKQLCVLVRLPDCQVPEQTFASKSNLLFSLISSKAREHKNARTNLTALSFLSSISSSTLLDPNMASNSISVTGIYKMSPWQQLPFLNSHIPPHSLRQTAHREAIKARRPKRRLASLRNHPGGIFFLVRA